MKNLKNNYLFIKGIISNKLIIFLIGPNQYKLWLWMHNSMKEMPNSKKKIRIILL